MRHFLNEVKKLPVAAILLTLSGLAMLLFPLTVITVLVRTIGILAILYALLHLCEIFATAQHTVFTPLSLLLVLALLACGIVLTVAPDESTGFFILIAGIYLVFDGVGTLYRLHAARAGFSRVTDMPAHGYAYWCTLVMALAGCVLGIVMILLPRHSARVVAILIGIALLSSGVRMLLLWIRARRLLYAARIQSEKHTYVEADFTDKTGEDE